MSYSALSLGIPLVDRRSHSSTDMEAEVGVRVARGPDWQWGDQDGGEGCLGTITEVGSQGNAEGALPLVLWDYGYRSNNYRCGKEGKYDLVVYDSAPAGEPIYAVVYENHLSSCSGIFRYPTTSGVCKRQR